MPSNDRIGFTLESLDGLDLTTFGFDYATLCAIQERIGYAQVSALTLRKWMGEHGYITSVLTLDRVGAFVSLEGTSSTSKIP
jgi:hypothetical protein